MKNSMALAFHFCIFCRTGCNMMYLCVVLCVCALTWCFLIVQWLTVGRYTHPHTYIKRPTNYTLRCYSISILCTKIAPYTHCLDKTNWMMRMQYIWLHYNIYTERVREREYRRLLETKASCIIHSQFVIRT